MIVYNMRYRGPLEYDKFILNVLQYHNEVNELIVKEFGDSVESLTDYQDLINEIYKMIVGNPEDDTIVSLSEALYLNMLDLKEC